MLGVSGTPVLDAVGKLGDLGDRLNDKCMLSDFDSWTDDPTGRSVGWIRLLYILSTTIRSDGDYPSEGIPLRLHPTIRFGMAVDAIKRLGTTYRPVVRYYLANLGTTMESQVRSSVFLSSLSFCLTSELCRNLHPKPLSPLQASLCAALTPSY